MPYILVFVLELLLLASLTSHSSNYFLRFFYSLTGSEKVSIILFSVLFFPGTLIHELAHFLMAKLLLVHTSGMEFLPQLQGDSIKLGSVSIAKTDPIRRLLIGVAPVIVGLGILLGMLWGVQTYLVFFSAYPWWAWVALGYVVFVTGSTMFSSRKDLEGSLGVVAGILILFVLIFLTGFGWLLGSFYQFLTISANDFFKQISIFLGIPLGINAIIVLLGSLTRHRV